MTSEIVLYIANRIIQIATQLRLDPVTLAQSIQALAPAELSKIIYSINLLNQPEEESE